MTYWTKSQLQALDALGVPLYASVEQSVLPAGHSESDLTGHTYRLDKWHLNFDQRLPVEGYPWLNQLASHLGTRPTEIKTDTSTTALNVARFAKTHLSPDEKQILWQALSTWQP